MRDLKKIIEKSIPAGPFRLFIDVGLSHSAPHSQEWLETHEDAFVIGIEPTPASRQSIREKHILESEPRFLLLPYGIANVDKMEKRFFNVLQIGTDRGTSSFLDPTDSLLAEGWKVEEKIEVPVISLKMILDCIPWDRFKTKIFTMKSDTQGYECEVLRSLGHYLPQINEIQIENSTYDKYANAPTTEQIFNILTDASFVPVRHHAGNSWFVNSSL